MADDGLSECRRHKKTNAAQKTAFGFLIAVGDDMVRKSWIFRKMRAKQNDPPAKVLRLVKHQSDLSFFRNRQL